MSKAITTKKIVIMALFTALIAGATALQIPNGLGGNINLGDVLIIASSAYLGYYIVFPAAFGSALIDFLSPYAIYTPATFIIKAAMALICAYGFRKMHVEIEQQNDVRPINTVRESIKQSVIVKIIIIALIAEIIMIGGYFLYEWFLVGWQSAMLGVPFNGVQAIFGVIGGSLLTKFFWTKNIINRL